ncbi:hypothetical protein [Streptomyces qinglanensis]|uniref:hypothetical protein n=1 Tax=Streptomyces qinglanensis TaxID=943816 RepID=UPI003D73CBA7
MRWWTMRAPLGDGFGFRVLRAGDLLAFSLRRYSGVDDESPAGVAVAQADFLDRVGHGCPRGAVVVCGG